MSTYAIGDIQGCFQSFQNLLDRLCFDPEKDRLWLTGDLVNRGPRSLETLRYVQSLGDSALTVLGNHDLYLMMLAEGKIARKSKNGSLKTLLEAPDRDMLLNWLRKQPLCHVEGGYCLVHAGLLPGWDTDFARALALEVETCLKSPDYPDFLENLWGNSPDQWSAHLEKMDRMRLTVNAMTRMRFCTPDGKMEFSAKGKPENAPPGFLPWFLVPGRKSAQHTLITGHWSAMGLKITPNLLALDSGCLWGGQLTAVRLEDRRIFQVGCAPGESLGLGED